MKTLAPDSRVDEYIELSPAYAQPILSHLRTVVHRAVPLLEETIKWGAPFFTYRGKLLCYMAAFKQHCRVGLWGAEMAATLKQYGFEAENSKGSFRRITTLKDLPPDQILVNYLRQAAAIADEAGTRPKTPAKPRTIKAEIAQPPELVAALDTRPDAKLRFAALSPSCRREYIEWITSAKRPETRGRRIAATVAQVTEGGGPVSTYQRS